MRLQRFPTHGLTHSPSVKLLHTLSSEPRLLETTRLAFAMAAHLEPEILLVDVVLVVEVAAC